MPFVINDNSAAAPGTEGSPKGAFSRTRSQQAASCLLPLKGAQPPATPRAFGAYSPDCIFAAFFCTRSAGGINGVFEFRVDVFANWG